MKESRSLLQKTGLAIVTLLALGIGYSRYNISSRKRTSQPGIIYSQKSRGQGFAFKLIQRSNSSHKEPTGIMEAWSWPGASGVYKNRSSSPPLHVHTSDDEIFEVLDGRLGYYLDGKEGILEKGQKALLPVGKVHTFWNAAPDRILHQRITTINRNGKHSPNERFFEQWASNAFDHDGLDNVFPLQLILMLKAGHIELAGPYPLRLFVRYIVCPFAELLGYKGSYPEYVYP